MPLCLLHPFALSAFRSFAVFCRDLIVEKLRKMIAVDGSRNPTTLPTRLSANSHDGVGKSKVQAEIFHWGKSFTVRNMKAGTLRRMQKNQMSKQIPLVMDLLHISLWFKVWTKVR